MYIADAVVYNNFVFSKVIEQHLYADSIQGTA